MNFELYTILQKNIASHKVTRNNWILLTSIWLLLYATIPIEKNWGAGGLKIPVSHHIHTGFRDWGSLEISDDGVDGERFLVQLVRSNRGVEFIPDRVTQPTAKSHDRCYKATKTTPKNAEKNKRWVWYSFNIKQNKKLMFTKIGHEK